MMNDKERILTHIISIFYPKYLLPGKWSMDTFNKCNDDSIQVGDLVLATTSGIHNFTIGYVVKKKSNWEMTLREIGNVNTCNIENEQFYKIDVSQLDRNILLEGEQYLLYEKIKKAFDLLDDDSFAGHKTYQVIELEFSNKLLSSKKCVTVYLRKKWTEYNKKTAPKITFNYDDKTSIEDIIKEVQRLLID